MKKIELHGDLGKRFGSTHFFDVQTVTEALSALTYQIEGFEEYFCQGHYELVCGPMSYGPDNFTFTFRDRLDIIPVAAGSKKGGAGKLILGIALVGLAFAGGIGVFGALSKGFLTTAAAGGGLKATLIGGAIKYFGVSAMIGGAAALLSPKPDVGSVSKREASNPSMLINGAIQTVEEGAGHPICLGGPFMCGSHIVSGGLYVEEFRLAPTQGSGGFSGGFGGNGSTPFDSTQYNSLHYENDTVFGEKGKGGGTQRVATEAANTLMVEMSAKITDLISVGECYGWDDAEHPLRCYFMDETPVERENGTEEDIANFKGLEVHTRLGLPGQDHIPGFDEQTGESTVDTAVTLSGGIVARQINDLTLDAVRVTLLWPTMTEQNTENGDLYGSSVHYQVGVRGQGSSDYEWVVDKVFSEKFVSPVQVQHRVELPTGEGPWTIAVRRLSPDSSDVAVQNSFSWLSYTRIIDAKLSHPGSALVGTIAAAKQFGDKIPKRGFKWRGIICSLPTNYDPITRKYTGIWDGTWKRGWTNNGVWVTYEVMTNTDWGFGKHIPAGLINKFAFYEAAKICDQPVPDGYGGYEPRWTMAAWTNTVEEARTYLQSLCSNFLGTMLWGRGAVQIAQDCRKKTSKVVTNANVIGGKFVYEGIGRKAIYTVALVTWNDPDNFFKPRIETVEASPEIIAKYGRRVKENVFAFGTTTRGQARRHGLWEIYRSIYSNPFVTYKAGLDHASVIPGEVVDVADVNDQGVRLGGRIKEHDGLNVTLDTEFNFEAGKSYVLEIALAEPILSYPTFSRSIVEDGIGTDYVDLNILVDADDRWVGTLVQGAVSKTIQQTDGSRVYLDNTTGLGEGPVTLIFSSSDNTEVESIVVERVVTSPSGLRSSITINEALPSTDEEYVYVYGLKTDDLTLSRFTVLSFEDAGDGEYEIVGLRYHSEIFDLVEDDKEFSPRSTSLYDTTIPAEAPSNPEAAYRLIQTPKGGREIVELRFEKSPTPLVTNYEILHRYRSGAWSRMESISNIVEIPYSGAGEYQFSISAVPAYGKQSAPIFFNETIGEDRQIGTIEITNVRISGEGSLLFEFSGPELQVEWDVSPPEGYGGDSTTGWMDPFFKDYEIRIKNGAGSVLRSYYTTDQRIVYSAEMLREDNGGFERTIGVEIRLRDNYGTVHPWSTLKTFTNPRPAVPDYEIQESITGFSIVFAPSADTDFKRNCVWVSETSTVTVDRVPDHATSQNTISIETPAGSQRWIKIGRTDAWSSSDQDCVKSSTIGVTALSSDEGLTSGDTTHVDGVASSLVRSQAALVPGLNDALETANDLIDTLNTDVYTAVSGLKARSDSMFYDINVATTGLKARSDSMFYDINVATIGLKARSDSMFADINTATTGLKDKTQGILDALNTPTTGVVARLTLTESTLNTPTTGLVARTDALEAAVGAPSTGLMARLVVAEEAIVDLDEGKASVERVSVLEAASRSLPNIILNGGFTDGTNHWGKDSADNWTVYQHPVLGVLLNFESPYVYTDNRSVSPDDVLSLSWEGDNPAGGYGQIQWIPSYSVGDAAPFPGVWGTRAKLEGQVAPAGTNAFRVVIYKGSAANATIGRVKVNYGSTATNWSDETSEYYATARLSLAESAITTNNSAAVTRLSALEATVDTPGTGLSARLTTAESAITTNNSAAVTRLNSLEAAIDTPTTGLLARIGSAESAITTNNSAAVTRLNSLEATVNTAGTGLSARLTTAESAITTNNSAAVARLNSLETAINTAGTGVLARLLSVENIVSTPTTGLVSRTTALETQINTPSTGLIARIGLNETAITNLNTNKAEATRVAALEVASRSLPNLIRNADFAQGIQHWGKDEAGYFDRYYHPVLGTIAQFNGAGYIYTDNYSVGTSGDPISLSFEGVGAGSYANIQWIPSFETSESVAFPTSWGERAKLEGKNGPAGTTGFRLVFYRGGAPETFVTRVKANYGSFASNWSDENTAFDNGARLISAETAITTNNSAAVTRLNALEATVNTAGTGVVARLTTAESAITTNNSAAVTRLNALETTINTAGTGVVARLAAQETALSTLNSSVVTRFNALEATVNTAGTGLSARMGTAESAISDLNSGKASVERVTFLEAYTHNMPNMLRNSDFSQGGKYWTGTFVFNTSEGVFGSYAFCDAAGDRYLVSDIFRARPGDTFSFSLTGDPGSVPSASAVYVQQLREDNSIISDGNIPEYLTGMTWENELHSSKSNPAGMTTAADCAKLRVVIKKGAATNYIAVTRIMFHRGTHPVAWMDNATANDAVARLGTVETAVTTNNSAAVSRLDLLEATVDTPGTGVSARLGTAETGIANLVTGKADSSRVSFLEARTRTAPNLIVNSTAAAGMMGWSHQVNTNINADLGSVDGPRFLMVGGSLSTAANATTDYFPIQASSLYSFQGEFYAEGLTAGEVRAYVVYYRANDSIALYQVITVTTDKGWELIKSEAFNVPSGDGIVKARIYIDVQSATFTVAGWRRLKLENSPICTYWSDDATDIVATAKLTALETAVTTNNTAAVGRLNALEASVNTAGTGLLAKVATHDTAIASLETGKASASSVTVLEVRSVSTPNLLPNPQFLDGIEGYYTNGTATPLYDVQIGSYVNVAAGNYITNDPGQPAFPGMVLSFSFDGDPGGATDAQVYIQWLPSYAFGGGISAFSGDWTIRKFFDSNGLYPAPSGTTGWRIVAQAGASSALNVSRIKVNYGGKATNWSAETEAKNAYAKITDTSTVALDAQGKANAIVGHMIDVNGHITGTVSENDGENDSYTIITSKFGLVDPSGATGTTFTDGRWTIVDLTADTRTVYGRPFGGSEKLNWWTGSNSGVAPGSEAKGNANVYISMNTVNGPRFGGSDVPTGGGGGTIKLYDIVDISGSVSTSWSTVASSTFTSRPSAGYWDMVVRSISGTADGGRELEFRVIENEASTALATGLTSLLGGGVAELISLDFSPFGPWAQTRPAGSITLLLQCKTNTGTATISGQVAIDYKPGI